MICCKGTCERTCLQTFDSHQPRYENGHKYCAICEVWFMEDMFRCPCCNVKLRTKARTIKKKVVI